MSKSKSVVEEQTFQYDMQPDTSPRLLEKNDSADPQHLNVETTGHRSAVNGLQNGASFAVNDIAPTPVVAPARANAAPQPSQAPTKPDGVVPLRSERQLFNCRHDSPYCCCPEFGSEVRLSISDRRIILQRSSRLFGIAWSKSENHYQFQDVVDVSMETARVATLLSMASGCLALAVVFLIYGATYPTGDDGTSSTKTVYLALGVILLVAGVFLVALELVKLFTSGVMLHISLSKSRGRPDGKADPRGLSHAAYHPLWRNLVFTWSKITCLFGTEVTPASYRVETLKLPQQKALEAMNIILAHPASPACRAMKHAAEALLAMA